MKYLLLLRHAKSSWKQAGLADFERPLNKRGRRDAPRVGRHLAAEGLLAQAVLCSTAARARETIEGFLSAYPFDGEVQYLDELYHADAGTILALLAAHAGEAETALVVGHNPGLDEFLETVCGEFEHMPTAGLAYVRFPIERWRDLGVEARGELLQLWKPRDF